MTPIDFTKIIYSEREEKMRNEVLEFIDANVNAAEVWKDSSVANEWNVELYKRILRKMRISDRYTVCQKRGKIIIRKVEMND